MHIYIYHHRKIIARALSQLLENEGYQVFYKQEYGLLQSHIPFKDSTLFFIDLDSLAYLEPLQVSILRNIKQNIILLGSPHQLNWYFKLSSKSKSFICKPDKDQLLFTCIKKLQNQNFFLCSKTTKFINQEKFEQQKILLGDGLNKPLTKTELKVMLEIGNGKTTGQIAESWSRSPYTVNNHRKNIKGKLKNSYSFQLSRFCFEKTAAIETLVALKENKKFIKAFLKND